MLWTIVVVLLALWLLGLATSYTVDGFFHTPLLVVIAVVLTRVIQGKTNRFFRLWEKLWKRGNAKVEH